MKNKKMPPLATRIFLTVISISVLIGCGQSSEFNPEPQNKANDTEVRLSVKSGILVFDNWGDFNKMANTLGKMSVNKRRSWEAEHEFVSMASIFEDILEAEESNELAYYQKYLDQGYTDNEIESLEIPRPEHSTVYHEAKKNIQSLYLKILIQRVYI